MIPGKTELSGLIRKGLIEGAIDADAQTQVNGLELTVEHIEAFDGPGRIGFDNADRKLPVYQRLEWDSDGWLFLPKGCYKIVFNEIVSIPKDMCAIARPRSSLLRMGATVETAIWDAGYRGRSEALLVVHNEQGLFLKKDTRAIQLIFMHLSSEQEGYSGRYMNENIKK
ncbi:putative dUTP pyrophosphatase [Methanocella arvoryzae MRE50]|uniref:dUTP pyrophosphatase n=2 Tax=Methanocella TaxID=570266 RepID=Q0W397_METAR|nr:deoxyuridine 5'-triphosphate nucleotidohydrolase [Methanocella arvoryzae]CAJ37146.1 putative dUTP pyrophosphatase [Methanocella arvoryzae MRE50]